MWWSERERSGGSPVASGDRRRVLALFLVGSGALLSACALAPALGPGSGAAALRGRVAIRTEAKEALGFALVEALEDTFGVAEGNSPFVLEVAVQAAETAAGRLPDRGPTRRRIVGRARWRLMRRDKERPLASGEVASFTAYDVAGTPLAERTARRDARVRLGRDLGRRVVEAVLLAVPEAGTGNGSG